MGYSLAEPVQTLGAWAFGHLDSIGAAQAQYDARTGGVVSQT